MHAAEDVLAGVDSDCAGQTVHAGVPAVSLKVPLGHASQGPEMSPL